MTDKQLNILDAALALFALEGYNATSTSKIARHADVSEGLIFRHFGSKEGLLQAVIAQGLDKAAALFEEVYGLSDPQARLEAVIGLPFQVPEADYDFWRLQYKLKWELQHKELNRVMAPLQRLLVQTFTELGHSAPAAAAEYMMHHFDGVTAALLKNEIPNLHQAHEHWLAQYRSSGTL